MDTFLQSTARYVTKSNEEDGFAYAVERFILCETAPSQQVGARYAPGRH